MRKAILTFSFISIFSLAANATDFTITSKSYSEAKPESSEKPKNIIINKSRKATDILAPLRDTNKNLKVLTNNNEIIYQPIFEGTKLKVKRTK